MVKKTSRALTILNPSLGWIFSAESVGARIDRDLGRFSGKKQAIELSIHPSVSAYLMKEGAQVKKLLEKEHMCFITIIEDGDLDQDEYTIKPKGSK